MLNSVKQKKFNAAVSMLVCAVSACGGGGSSGVNPHTSDTVLASTIFIDPAGPLCAQRDTLSGYCIQPTSSSATVEGLQAAMIDPNGERFAVDSFGWASDAKQNIFAGAYVGGNSFNYSMLKKTLIFGKNQIIVDNKTYSNNGPYAFNSSFRFLSGQEPIDIMMNWPGALIFWQEYDAYLSKSGTTPFDFSVNTGEIQWTGIVGALTDKHDAPVESEITFTGYVSILGGDGSAFDPPINLIKLIGGKCPITLVLNTSTGALRSDSVKCISSGSNTDTSTIAFDLPTLFFENSRVRPLVGSEASISIAGLADNAPGASVDATFKATKIEGALFGVGAKYLNIMGAGTLGSFTIFAMRQ